MAKTHRRKWRFALTSLLIVGIVGGVLAMLTRDLWFDDIDHQIIRAERYKRWKLHQLGQPWPTTPDVKKLDARLAAQNLKLGAPIFMRIYKRSFELELWMQREGVFYLFATYPICKWSGRLGPKRKEGDHQAPEGVYTVGADQLNPNSRWHRSFNLGYPNAYDRAHGRTGSFLMVHGGCGSVGCYAMTDPVVSELWHIITAAFDKGQRRFQVHSFPFRLTDAALEARRAHPSYRFWRSLKPAEDLFNVNRVPPYAAVCDKRYVFEPGEPGHVGDARVRKRCQTVSQSRAITGAFKHSRYRRSPGPS